MSGYCGTYTAEDQRAEQYAEDVANDRDDRYKRGERAPCRNPECRSGGCPECPQDDEELDG